LISTLRSLQLLSNVENLRENCFKWLQDLRVSLLIIRKEGFSSQKPVCNGAESQSQSMGDWLMSPRQELRRDESRGDMPITEFSSRKSKLMPSLQFSQRSVKKGSGGGRAVLVPTYHF
jgi:hypothetical protein